MRLHRNITCVEISFVAGLFAFLLFKLLNETPFCITHCYHAIHSGSKFHQRLQNFDCFRNSQKGKDSAILRKGRMHIALIILSSHTFRKRHRLVASCQFYRFVAICQQVATNLSILSSRDKSFKIRLVATCDL